MTGYKHILVATDFSTYSENAARRAKDLAEIHGAEITLLHVVDYLPPSYVAVELPTKFGSESWMLERAQTQLEEWAQQLDLGTAKKAVTTGFPKREVVRVAKETGVDLIVIGTSGAGALKRLVGSTTTAVLNDAPCDILSVQAAAEEP